MVALHHRRGSAAPVSEDSRDDAGTDLADVRPRPPVAGTLVDEQIAAMFGSACRHAVKCGIGVGFATRCDYIEDTMKKMPKALGIGDCTTFDDAEAKKCILALAAMSCADDFAQALDIPSLQRALGRIQSCRRACP